MDKKCVGVWGGSVWMLQEGFQRLKVWNGKVWNGRVFVCVGGGLLHEPLSPTPPPLILCLLPWRAGKLYSLRKTLSRHFPHLMAAPSSFSPPSLILA